ncbi:MAG: CheR family methyltransferase [Cycloclasticus sp.]
MLGLFRKKKPSGVVQTPADTRQDFHNIQFLAEYVKNETGINFEKQASIFKSKLISFCKQRGVPSFDECLAKAKRKNEFKQELFNYLTTNETYFYREFGQIEKLVAQVAASKNPVDILCLPCSTGEEPYTIVIALLEAGVDAKKFNLIGVDIDTAAVKRAIGGVYNVRDVSKMPTTLAAKYFVHKEGKYHLDERIKSSVTFKTFNLFDPMVRSIGEFDFVLSRNMLIYFDKETKLKASDILTGLLKDKKHPIYYGHADLY